MAGIKTIVWGFETNISCYAIQELEKQKYISIIKWYGNSPERAVKVENWSDILLDKMAPDQLLHCEDHIYDSIYKQLPAILDMFSRNFIFQHKPVHEYINAMHLLLYSYYALLKRENVQLILFADIPHDPENYILYLLAKALKIKVLILRQSQFPNRFFYLKTIEDFGKFEEVPEYKLDVEKVNIEEKFEKKWFYADRNWSAKPKSSCSFSAWKKKSVAKFQRSLKKYDGFYDMFLKKTIIRVLEKHLSTEYKSRCLKTYREDIDLTAKFVYFPLHLQPEMTTSALGGIYANQLLAVERTAAVIPDDWYVYVKEYPRQTYLMRDKYFFERLSLIPKVRPVSSKIDTFDLMRHSQFVATLVGTAGWEAISGGKNVLIFGDAWYRNLPGVFEYTTDLSIHDLLDYHIQHGELEQRLAELFKKTGNAMVSKDYLPLVGSGFNAAENNRNLFDFLVDMIPRI